MFCNNRHRKNVVINEKIYDLDLQSVQRNSLDTKFSKKTFLFFEDTNNPDTVSCKNCRLLFDFEMEISYENLLPSFLWYIFSDSLHRQIYGKKLWSIFPLKWRELWLESIS